MFLQSRAVELTLLVCLRSSCCHVTGRMAERFVRLALKVVVHNDGDFVDAVVLYCVKQTLTLSV